MEVAMSQAPQRSDLLGVDEDMEISSEAGRGGESDVELFDLDDDTATNAADDEMVDDNEHEVKDEDMDEEFPRENTVDMDDEIVYDDDVEITEVEDTVVPEKDASAINEGTGQPALHSSTAVTDFASKIETVQQETPIVQIREVDGSSAAEPLHSGGTQVDSQSEEQQTKTPPPANSPNVGPTAVEEQTTEAADDEQIMPVVLTGGDASQTPVPGIATQQEAAEPLTFASPPHEVRIMYEGNDMCLFAPKDAQDTRTYLLQDSALIHSSVTDLFPACRAVLADSIDEKDELVLEISDLGLKIGEKSVHRPAASLSDVVDVYLALSYNDSSAEPSPLYMKLHVVHEFQSRLDQLHDLASEGQGFAAIIEPIDSSDEEWPEEDEEEGSSISAKGGDSQLAPPKTEHEGAIRPNQVEQEKHGDTKQKDHKQEKHTAAEHEADSGTADEVSDVSNPENTATDAVVQVESEPAIQAPDDDIFVASKAPLEAPAADVQHEKHANDAAEPHKVDGEVAQHEDFALDFGVGEEVGEHSTEGHAVDVGRESGHETEHKVEDSLEGLEDNEEHIETGLANFENPSDPSIAAETNNHALNGTAVTTSADAADVANTAQDHDADGWHAESDLHDAEDNSVDEQPNELSVTENDKGEAASTSAPTAGEDDVHEDDDFIDFSEDEEAAEAAAAPSISRKRSWEERATVNDAGDDAREAKKVKA